MTPAIAITVDDKNWKVLRRLQSATKRVVEACMSETGSALHSAAELSILLCGDETIRELNRTWRGIDKATNVLSFPLAKQDNAYLLGDIAISFQTVDREAAAEGKSLFEHYSHMIAHGFLHLLGFDHEIEADAEIMEAMERRVLARVGISDPYLEKLGERTQ